jgi:hypothetical protein
MDATVTVTLQNCFWTWTELTMNWKKRERELAVPMRPWPFTVPDRPTLQPFAVPYRLHKRFWTFHERSWTFHERFPPFSTACDLFKTRKAKKHSWNVQKRSGTLDGQGRWTVWNDCKITFTLRSHSRFKNERIPVFKGERDYATFSDPYHEQHECLRPFIVHRSYHFERFLMVT